MGQGRGWTVKISPAEHDNNIVYSIVYPATRLHENHNIHLRVHVHILCTYARTCTYACTCTIRSKNYVINTQDLSLVAFLQYISMEKSATFKN